MSKFSAKNILRNLFKNNIYFQAGLIFKLILSIFFASTYLSDLFAPFIKSALTSGFSNVYVNFYHSNPRSFPYPPVMLYLLALPRFILSIFRSANAPVSFLDIFSARIPLLAADILILVILIKWLRKYNTVVWWFWLNPIVIYISYIHGQLDIIPTSLLCLSLYFLFSNRLTLSAVVLAFACATKFHIVMVIPFILIFIYKIKRPNTTEVLKYLVVFIFLLFALNLPFLFQEEFVKMVYHNEEQSKVLFSVFPLFENYNIILVPAFYIVILYAIMEFRFVNRDILLIFLAISFGITTFFIVPKQGWYLWNIPFFVYFIIRFNFKAAPLFILLNVAYFAFFIISPDSDFPLVAQFIFPSAKNIPNIYTWLQYHNINTYNLLQIVFTFLQITLLLFCASIFRLGVLYMRKHKIYHEPYLIGIAGDSGTGKTLLSGNMQGLFGGANTLLVHGDDMHRWERGHEKWNEFTHLNPMANWLHRDLSQLIDLRAGKRVMRNHYNHDTGRFTALTPVNTNRIIVYEGLHSFYLKEASKIYDLKIFMKPSEQLRRFWKMERDTKERGHGAEKVLAAIEKRSNDAKVHVMGQESAADIVFSLELTDESVLVNQPDKVEDYLCLRINCSNDVYFEHLVDYLKSGYNLNIEHEIDKDNQVLTIKGHITSRSINEIATNLNISLEEIIGYTPKWRENYLGLMQLFVLYIILTQFKRSGYFIASESI